MPSGRKSKFVAVLSVALVVSACGGGGDEGGTAPTGGGSTEASTAATGGESEGGSTLGIAASALVRVQSMKYEDYEVDGDTVRLKVRDGVELAGSECVIIDAATGADYPDAKFVLVEPDGTETAC